MFTTNQLIAHLVGDFFTQSDWMANKKHGSSYVAALHAVAYSIPFLFISNNIISILLIVSFHFFIDRYSLAKYVIFAKNFLAPKEFRFKWSDCSGTGYHKDRSAWLSTWLLIITDNTMHLISNGIVLYIFA